jgi:hypothetical protein
MQVYWGQITGTDEWQAVRGRVVRKAKDAAQAYRAAMLLAGHQQRHLRKRNFPAPKGAPPAPSKAKPEPAAPEDNGAPVDLLASNSKTVKSAIRSGDHDAHLAALLAAEEAGAGRKTVVAAIRARME